MHYCFKRCWKASIGFVLGWLLTCLKQWQYFGVWHFIWNAKSSLIYFAAFVYDYAVFFELFDYIETLQSINRIISMTSSRSDWCISRQRTWGVPIPVFYHVHSKEPLINADTISHIKGMFLYYENIALYWLLCGVIQCKFLFVTYNIFKYI